jgi:hypothetical protein
VKISYRVELGDVGSRYRLKGFSIAGLPLFCCDRMRNEWGRLVEFGLRGFAKPENLGCYLSTHHLLSERTIVSSVDQITHCPWCGAAIELVEQHPAFGNDDGDGAVDIF